MAKIRPIDAHEIWRMLIDLHSRIVPLWTTSEGMAMVEVVEKVERMLDRIETIPGNEQVLLRAHWVNRIKPIDANILRRKVVRMYNRRAAKEPNAETAAAMWTLREIQRLIDETETLSEDFMNEYTKGGE